MSRYAEGTSVSVQSSQAELQLLLVRRGADQVVTGWDQTEGAMVQFRIQNRYVQLNVPKPDVKKLQRQHPQTPVDRLEAQEDRRMWRALILLAKAKFEAVDAGITSFDKEFLADLMMPNGKRLMTHMRPQLEEMYSTGRMPLLLPAKMSQS